MAADAPAVQAFVDGWSAFALEMVAISTFALWASRDPAKHVSVVWLVVWLQVFHGIVGGANTAVPSTGLERVGSLVRR